MLIPDKFNNDAAKALFDAIYLAAKEQDYKTIYTILTKEFHLDIALGGMTPLQRLAEEGHIEAVNWLITNFNAPINNAAKGYARVGNHEQVNRLIEAGARISYVISGYAEGGYKEYVDKAIPQDADCLQRFYRNTAAAGYARGGHFQHIEAETPIIWIAKGAAYASNFYKVDELLLQSRNDPEGHFPMVLALVVEAYLSLGYGTRARELLESYDYSSAESGSGLVSGGYRVDIMEEIYDGTFPQNCSLEKLPSVEEAHIKDYIKSVIRAYGNRVDVTQINRLMAHSFPQGWSIFRYVEQSLMGSSYVNTPDKFLRLLAFIENDSLRRSLAFKMSHKFPEKKDFDVQGFLAQPHELLRIMREYHLPHTQAQGLLVKGARPWLLQGQQIAVFNPNNNAPSLPMEIYTLIASLVMGLSCRDAMAVFAAVNRHLFLGNLDRALTNFKRGLFSVDQYRAVCDLELEKCENRMLHSK